MQVNKAVEGRYSANALDNVSLKRANQWFTKHGDVYTVKQDMKKRIDFSVFDLCNEQLVCPPASIFGDFDLVVCANLLFYYKPEYQKIIVEKAGNCLTNGGYLITGETERDIVLGYNFREVFPQSAIFQKIGRR
jgi:chemotaxis methyl-accepting protein methylase